MPDRPTSEDVLEHRVEELERTIRLLSHEVTTQRLVVVDARGAPRIVAEVTRGTAELRVTLPAGHPSPEVVLHAGTPDLEEAAPAVGLQLRANGDALAAFEASRGGDGGWRPCRPDGVISERPAPRTPPPATCRPRPATPGPSGSPA
jgi:hypothetical protein